MVQLPCNPDLTCDNVNTVREKISEPHSTRTEDLKTAVKDGLNESKHQNGRRHQNRIREM